MAAHKPYQINLLKKSFAKLACSTNADCGANGYCDTSTQSGRKCVCDEGKKGDRCDQDINAAQLTVNQKQTEPIKVFFSPSLQTSTTNICIGNSGDYSMDFKVDASATQTSSSWDLRLQPSDGSKRTINPWQACETFVVTTQNLDTSKEWTDSTVVRFLWKATTETDFSQTTVSVICIFAYVLRVIHSCALGMYYLILRWVVDEWSACVTGYSSICAV